MKIIRVFPRRTLATLQDENVRFSEPGFFDEADAVCVSVTFDWDKQWGEYLANSWSHVTKKIFVGGPAYGDPGGEFTPGMFLKPGYVITSRGCPNSCWFCPVPGREGKIRELEIKDGYIVQDNNLLACSDSHIKKVFEMLARQKYRARFQGGFEAKRLKPWIVEELKKINPMIVYFAYDTPDDYEPLAEASRLLKEMGALTRKHVYSCYVLIGYKGDTFEKAEKRMKQVFSLGFMTMAMLYNKGREVKNRDQWISFQRQYSNRFIVGIKMRKDEEIIWND